MARALTIATATAIQYWLLFGAVLPSVGTTNADQRAIKLLDQAPDWLRPCRLKDPELNSCVKDTFQNMFPALAKGIPEIHVDRFEPLYLSRLSLSKGHGPVTITGSFYDILAHGPSKAKATSAVLDMDRRVFELGVFLPEIRIESDYNLQGKVLILPLIGNGPAKVNLDNVTTSVSTRFELRRLQGRQVLHIADMTVDFDIQGMTVNLENLFNGNKVLGRTLNAFVNKNALEIVKELKDPLGESFSVVFKDIMNNALSHMPIDLWLLDQ
ncbi:Protein takeout [Zootermopsis nevadensis]|uniref:Protein takeout n=2 Tax=Zootermopsis nevadensis TaxID=136037 RepID=A0A067QV95_ZOONE|nr:Protein takeout [Zootermopsis nevadensis]